MGRCFEERPQLIPILRDFGSLSLASYGKSLISQNGTLSPVLRKILSEIVAERFGRELSSVTSDTFAKISSIDTAGHGGVLSEDTLIQGHLIGARAIKESGYKLLLTLACGVVPMNNSTWPRGFFVQGERESIFPKSFDRIGFYECSAFTKDQLIKSKSSEASPRKKAVIEFIEAIPGIFEHETFATQTSIINHLLWMECFERRGEFPEFVQLLLEEVTSQLVIHSIETNDYIAQILFSLSIRTKVLERLSGLPGTWNLETKKGTHFFWAAAGDFRNASLWVEGDVLRGKKDYRLTPDEILSGLKSRELVPSVFLSLLSLLKNGVRCLGGYHQVYYLPEYRDRLKRIRDEEPELGKVMTEEDNRNLCCMNLINLSYGPVYLVDDENPNQFAFIDSFLLNPERAAEAWKSLDEVTLLRASVLNLKRWYQEIVPKSSWDKDLKGVSIDQIFSDLEHASL